MLSALYTMIVYPLELLLEIVFSILKDTLDNTGLSIVGVSIVVNILLLPLYNRADRISGEERAKQKEMKPMVDHIRKVFTGDERFMILQTYYRKQDYHPLYSLRSSLPLLLQIPFFIAAYHFLSHLSLLNDCVFGIIRDLGKPDTMITIPRIALNIYTERFLLEPLTVSTPSTGTETYSEMLILHGFAINVLPILMTFINIISILIYTKDSPKKEKVQLYIMAGLFLVLLYNSPSGLVVYWTMNNIFSLIKNVVLGIRKKKKKPADLKESVTDKTDRDTGLIFIWAAVLLTVLIGVLIPSSVIVSSPSEFVITTAYKDPLHYVFSTFLIAVGFFLIWLPVFYYLASKRARSVMTVILTTYGLVALVDFMAFGRLNVYVSARLRYESEVVFSSYTKIINTVTVVTLIIITIVIFMKRKEWLKPVFAVLTIGLVLLASVNIVQTENKLSANIKELKTSAEDYKGFTLSRNGKNVIVIMLDRYLGPYLPYVLQEKPELIDKLDGFVYYPNTVSFGGSTASASAALFGGYEYTTGALDERPDEKLVDKQNEALKIMPVVFSEHGFKTTVYDPPLAGFEWVPDLSIYDDYPDIHAYNLQGKFIDPTVVDFIEKYRKRSFFMYSIHKSVPVICQMAVYDEGTYHHPDNLSYFEMAFFNCYSVLQNLTRITDIEDSDQNTFMMMDNETPHNAIAMQLPDYTFSGTVNNHGLETGYRTGADGKTIIINGYYDYHAHVASMIQICKWLDYLRETGVYDNTRIIMVADHGKELGDFEDLILDDGTDIEGVIPLLMYKDFNSKEPLSTSIDFMTNADTPTMAMKDLINDPVNPFTGKKIDDTEKKDHDQLILCSAEFGSENKNDTMFYKPGQPWYTVHDNVYDKNNWARADMSDKEK